LAEDQTDRGRPPGDSALDVEVLSELAAVVTTLAKALTRKQGEE
jgi:hypothetical protein